MVLKIALDVCYELFFCLHTSVRGLAVFSPDGLSIKNTRLDKGYPFIYILLKNRSSGTIFKLCYNPNIRYIEGTRSIYKLSKGEGHTGL